MSTRAVITVKDGYDEEFSIYRHGDGYPDGPHGVLAELERALPFAWALPRFEAMDFAAAIIAAWKAEGGGGIYCTKSRDAHGDLAYAYEVTQTRGTPNVLTVAVFEPSYNRKTFEIQKWKKIATHRIPNVGPVGELAIQAAEKV